MQRSGKRIGWFTRPWVWVCWIALAYGSMVWWGTSKSEPSPLPTLGTLKPFELINQGGQPMGSTQLKGKVWAANFIFTRCPTVCPLFTAKMAQVQHRTRGLGAGHFNLISFTVDPEYDTPAVLTAYAKRYKASAARWSFLTGSMDTIRSTVVDGLKVAMGNDVTKGNLEGIFHGSYIVLVDQKLRIRGYYDANDKNVVDRVVRDAGLLVNRGN